jgi:hypothetical protein
MWQETGEFVFELSFRRAEAPPDGLGEIAGREDRGTESAWSRLEALGRSEAMKRSAFWQDR